jgi:hypothetical protein
MRTPNDAVDSASGVTVMDHENHRWYTVRYLQDWITDLNHAGYHDVGPWPTMEMTDSELETIESKVEKAIDRYWDHLKEMQS